MKKVLIIICLVNTLSYSQQLYRQTFSSGVTTTQYGISMPGEAFNTKHTSGNIMVAESILYMTAIENTLNTPRFEPLDITLYPNPVADKLHIVGLKNLNAEVIVYNNLGKQVIKKQAATLYIDMSILPAGIYLLTIKDNNQITKHKVVKR